ncbi:PREDICTED: uncharacterized protein LOC104587707 [Nelumbo nucifera]|uniref:Uncharacterized protein LOC104587707 n=1 Tax=Nelumbo nucifera TaxID=4432 RepID=A0A1U7YZR5_NELNU|nr:PREDICTED: uncharacterized protein LOC104587707 [Nelumbo nucifera]
MGRMNVFSPDIITEPLPPNFKAPTLERYDKNTDPNDHLESFRALMILYGYSDALTCRTFQATFKGAARRWFSSLPPQSINSWEQFSSLFLARFISSRRAQKSVVSLMTVKQKRGESLRSYIDRFKKEELEVHDLNPMVSMHTAISELLPSLALKYSIAKSQPKTKLEFLERAQKYTVVKEALVGDIQERGTEHRDKDPEKKRKNGDHDRNNGNSKNNKKPPASALAYYQGNPKKYYKFHQGTSHDTEDCYDLKNEIESLICQGHLKQYVGGEAGASSTQQQHQQIVSVINIIAGGTASALARKAYFRQLSIQGPILKRKKQKETLSFTDEDLKGVAVPHDNTLVVSTIITYFVVKRILVDNGSSVDILFYEAFEKMKIAPERLQPTDVPLVGFSNNVVKPEGKITLPVTVGTELQQGTRMTEFLLVNGKYETREQSMSKNLAKVQDLAYHFQLFSLQQVPRAENVRADALSKLANTSNGVLG